MSPSFETRPCSQVYAGYVNLPAWPLLRMRLLRSLNQIAARGRGRGAVLAEGLDDVAADPPSVHFVRAVDQPLRAHLRVPLREYGILAEAERAVELDRGVDHVVHHVRQIPLCDRILLPQIH